MSNELNALLGKGSEFNGKLNFEGSVRIDGRFSGEIFSDGTLIIGEGAIVTAEINVATVAVYGEVTGNITATDGVELHAPASLRGNITSPALHIDKGVFFDGACQMTSPQERPAPPALPHRSAQRPLAPAQPLPPAAPTSMPVSQPVRNTGVFTVDGARTTGELTHKF
ncbi:MAG: bactofilin family protein [Myxococcota bacterium]